MRRQVPSGSPSACWPHGSALGTTSSRHSTTLRTTSTTSSPVFPLIKPRPQATTRETSFPYGRLSVCVFSRWSSTGGISAPNWSHRHHCHRRVPLYWWGLRPEPTLSTAARYRFAFTGDVPHPYDIVVEGQTVRMEPAGEHAAHVTLHCAAATFVLLMCGRYRLDTLITTGQVTVEGERGLVAAFGKWFQGM